MTAQDELEQVLRLLQRANDLVARLPTDDAEAYKTAEAAQKLRWVIRRLSKRAWLLASEIQPTA